jgi:hypothetical protein
VKGRPSYYRKRRDIPGIKAWRDDLSVGRLQGCQHPVADCLAIYNFSLPYEYRATNYQSPLPTVINIPLRGAHELYFYRQNEPLSIKVDFIDQNLDKKAAPLSLILYSDGKIAARRDLEDPNQQPASGRPEEKSLSLEEKDLPAGSISWKSSDRRYDIKKISSSIAACHSRGKFGRFRSGLTLYTDSPYLK